MKPLLIQYEKKQNKSKKYGYMTNTHNIMIIGRGFFGCRLAFHLCQYEINLDYCNFI